MSTRTLAVSGALLLSLAVPAGAAAAPTITSELKPCYVTAGTAEKPQSESLDLAAAGFTPSAKVDVAIDGTPLAGATGLVTDGTGALGALSPVQIPAPFVAKGNRRFTVTLTEQGNPANTVSATARATALGVTVKPQRARPDRRISFRGAGFTLAKPVYAHYVYDGRVRRTVRMVRKTGRCGTFKAKKPQIPVKDPATGIWTVQFDQLKKYVDPERNPINSAFVQLRISVSRQIVPR